MAETRNEQRSQRRAAKNLKRFFQDSTEVAAGEPSDEAKEHRCERVSSRPPEKPIAFPVSFRSTSPVRPEIGPCVRESGRIGAVDKEVLANGDARHRKNYLELLD